MKVDIKRTKNENFIVVYVETDKAKFNLFYIYDPDYDCWGLVEPKNGNGYKLYTLTKEFKTEIKNAVLDKLK